MRVLDLFSGIGGFSLGLERAGFETVAFCEIEKYPQKILKKHWPEVPIYEDIRKLNKEVLENDRIRSIDVICGGFPCQPFSVAGKQRGKEDDRHLWPEMLRLIKELKPRWVVGENVAGFINMALDDVLSDLEGEGYETQSFVIPACAVGGIHRRDRVWIVAHSQHNGASSAKKSRRERQTVFDNEKRKNKAGKFKRVCSPANVADTASFKSDGRSSFAKNANKTSEPIRRKSKPSAAYSTSMRSEQPSISQKSVGQAQQFRDGDKRGAISNSDDRQRTRQREHSRKILQKQEAKRHHETPVREFDTEFRPISMPTEPTVRHRDDGLPDNVARLKALGNAVVPQIPEIIGRAIMEAEKEVKK